MEAKLLIFCMGAGFYACYLLFAGQLSWSELCVAMPSAILSTMFLAGQSGSRAPRLAVTPWVCSKIALKALASVPLNTLRVGRILLHTLVRRPANRLGVQQLQLFRRGGDEPKDAGRRALVTLGFSLAPNGYVLDIPGEGGLLLHRLQPMPPLLNQGLQYRDLDWPL